MSFETTNLQYHKIWLTDFFHRFSHVDFSFSQTSATFDLDNESYRESLMLWFSTPLICCGVLMLLFVIYCVCRYFRSQPEPTHNQRSVGCKCCCSFKCILILFGVAAAGMTIYGSSQIQQGVLSTVHSLRTTEKTIQSALKITNVVTRLADDVERKHVPDLMNATSGIVNSTARGQILATIQQIGQNLNTTKQDVFFVKNSTNDMHTSVVAERMVTLEYIRWVAVIVICCLYILVFLLIVAGLLTKSRRKLILAAVLNVVVIMPAMWALASIHLALAVGSGDLCYKPNSFVLTQLNDTVDGDLLSVYLKCSDKSQPFGKEMLDAQTAVSQALTALSMTVNMSTPFNISDKLEGPVTSIRDDLQSVFGNLSSLNSLVGSCQTLHKEYMLIVCGVCKTSLYGVGYSLLASTLASLTCSLLVFCIARAWTSYGKKVRGQDGGYRPIDDTDPFVPTAWPDRRRYGAVEETFHNPAALPFGNALSINDADAALYNAALLNDSPPSCFHRSRLQEYNDLAPTPSSIIRAL